MPATATERSSTRSLLIPFLLVFGVVAIAIGPVGCGGDEVSEKPAADQADEATHRPVLLNLGVEDHTQQESFPSQFLVVTPGDSQWRPEPLPGGFVTKAFKKYPVGEPQKLYLYPEGKEGPRLSVPFTMKPDMNSVLATSRTNFAVYDDSIVVSGPAVPDEKIVYDRSASASP